jgi:hypothetical protein
VIGAGNQQERLEIANWIVGFTDGEGCFSVSAVKNSTTRFGRQIFPEFVVAQSAKSVSVLEEIKNFFGCGNIFRNERHDNHREDMYRYCVRSVSELNSRIVPFFDEFPLRSFKRNDFSVFREIVSMMSRKEHLTEQGWSAILELAGTMNRQKVRI